MAEEWRDWQGEIEALREERDGLRSTLKKVREDLESILVLVKGERYAGK